MIILPVWRVTGGQSERETGGQAGRVTGGQADRVTDPWLCSHFGSRLSDTLATLQQPPFIATHHGFVESMRFMQGTTIFCWSMRNVWT